MSAVAFVLLPDKFVLAGDGLAVDINKNPTRFNARKIFKITNNVGILWMGSMHHCIEILKEKIIKENTYTPYLVASMIGTILEEEKPGFIEKYYNGIKPSRLYGLYIVGFDDQGCHYVYILQDTLQMTSCQYKPKLQTFDYYQSHCIAESINGTLGTGFSDAIQYHCTPYQIGKTDAEGQIKKAFTQVVEESKEKGLNVGGEIFIETITPITIQGANF